MDQSASADYVAGYGEGLTAGFEQGQKALLGPAGDRPSNARVVGAWFILAAGLAGAAGILLTARKDSAGLGTTVLVSSSILTSVVTSLQILSSGNRNSKFL
jgi:hypothetical protein